MATAGFLFAALSLLCCWVEVMTQSHVVASLDETCEEYVDYLTGAPNGWPPIVLSAPHGGYLRPTIRIPDRDAGCWLQAAERCEFTHTCGEKDFTR